MFNLLIVDFVRNYEPALPPAGAGLFGLVEAALLVKEEPYPFALEAFAAINFVLLDLK